MPDLPPTTPPAAPAPAPPPAAPAAPPPAPPAAPAPAPAQPAAPAPAAPAPAPQSAAPVQLPDDHPLVKAFASVKAERADLKARIQAYEDLSKPPEERQAQPDPAGALASANLEILRYQVAAAKGIPLEHAARLIGTTREELEADAVKLAPTLSSTPGAAPPPPPPSQQPGAPAPRGGGDPTQEPTESDPSKLADAVPRP